MNNPNLQNGKAHLTTLHLKHFKMIDAVGLKKLPPCPLEWHYVHTKFHENLPNGSKVINGGHRQTET
jgi:hypothetical protein